MTDQPIAWLPIETAPKDGTLILLLCNSTDDPNGDFATEDQDWWRTIGHNTFSNSGVDHWDIAGWCWSHDCFTEGHGMPTHWLPLPICRTPCRRGQLSGDG